MSFILITEVPFSFTYLRDMVSREGFDSRGREMCRYEQAAWKDAYICLISQTVQMLSTDYLHCDNAAKLDLLLYNQSTRDLHFWTARTVQRKTL